MDEKHLLNLMFDETWLPTSENINKLPEPLRLHIHDLETNCDPAGNISQLALQKDTIKGLEKIVETQREEALKMGRILADISNDQVGALRILEHFCGTPEGVETSMLTTLVKKIIDENEHAHDALGRFPGSTLPLAVEVRINEYRAMEEKYEKMKVKLSSLESTVEDIKDATAMVEESAGIMQQEHSVQLLDKEKEQKKLVRKIELTVKDLAKAVSFQRKIGGRPFGQATAKFIIPALKRLGWKP